MNTQDVTLDQWNNPIWAVKTTQIPLKHCSYLVLKRNMIRKYPLIDNFLIFLDKDKNSFFCIADRSPKGKTKDSRGLSPKHRLPNSSPGGFQLNHIGLKLVECRYRMSGVQIIQLCHKPFIAIWSKIGGISPKFNGLSSTRWMPGRLEGDKKLWTAPSMVGEGQRGTVLSGQTEG